MIYSLFTLKPHLQLDLIYSDTEFQTFHLLSHLFIKYVYVQITFAL